ncbi:dehydrodolichyl diphosphate synthase complex subunit Dhdds-like [Dermacentor variabilis]|uniref:dehydrodolichyl diphosphate synthase complex subunit Dhdds-like n=1 Tax=Dermacentor variabilis TaxID=34621 RepID=UPI003F5C5596
MPDGSRRFVKSTGADLRCTYIVGTELLSWACQWCFQMGVSAVTVFMVASRHLTRSAYERDALFYGVIGSWFNNLHLSRIKALGIRMKCIGEMMMLPTDLKTKMREMEIATSDAAWTRTCLACVGYTTKRQMAQTALEMARAVKFSFLRSDDLTEDLMDAYINQAECPDVDVLMRCAGWRFSDFVVMQCAYAYLNMTSKKWPDIGFWDWVRAFLMYQLNWPAILAVKERHRALVASRDDMLDQERKARQQAFIRNVEAVKTRNVQGHAH